jgi:hypothetical protein
VEKEGVGYQQINKTTKTQHKQNIQSINQSINIKQVNSSAATS